MQEEKDQLLGATKVANCTCFHTINDLIGFQHHVHFDWFDCVRNPVAIIWPIYGQNLICILFLPPQKSTVLF